MLNSINLDDKSYEDLMAEALAKIPLYSREWTNFNRSDPGITMVQNLSSFSLLQQEAINTVSDAVRRQLLALVGYCAGDTRAASLLIQAPPGGNSQLPPQYQLRVGGLCFETEESITLDDWSLAAVYAVEEEAYQDITYLLDTRAGSTVVFGPHPQVGNAMCCVLKGTLPTQRPLRLWVQAAEEIGRNPFPESGGPVLARTRWQYYTAQGWVDAEVEDETRGFLISGGITLRLTGGLPVPFGLSPIRGCALRCILEENQYDHPPRLRSLAANLFPVRQWETRSRGMLLAGETTHTLLYPLAEQGYLFLYCREECDGPYRQYHAFTGISSTGRFYVREEVPGGVCFTFDCARFGFAPWAGADAVLAVCCDSEVVHHRELGPVYGYENQELELDLPEQILPGGLTLLRASLDEDGEEAWSLLAPACEDPEALCYQVDTEGKLCVLHPGPESGARLVLCDCRTTRGAEGNIRSGAMLEHQATPDQFPRRFYSPAPGIGGADYETVETLRRRFLTETRRPSAAVRPSDYEALVLRTPGLCIHKVKALPVPGENLVRIAIKPRSEEPFPMLSPLYLAELRAWLEPRRMLTTRVELLQPQYVPIDVRCVVYTKSYFDHALEEIEALLRNQLDYVNGPQGFGERVVFHQLYQALLELPCVEAVDGLHLHPAPGASAEGSDLKLDAHSLCYPGRLHVEIHAHPVCRKERR